MKIAWLCYRENDDIVIMFDQPEDWYYDRIVQIVYAEIVE